MSTRLVFVVLIFLAVPLCSQQTAMQTQQRIWARGQGMRPDSPPELDTQAARLEAIHHDAADLSTLSGSLQSDLQQLQKGMLAKDLAQKLKQIEKLSKKLRQEVAP